MLDFHRDDFQPDSLTPYQRQLLEKRKARAARIHAAACHRESSKPVPRIVEVKLRDRLGVPLSEPVVEQEPPPPPKPKPRRKLGPIGSYDRCRFIQRVVATEHKTSVRELISASRVAHLVAARFLAIYLVKEIVGSSLLQIGRRFGWRDHTTVIHAIECVKERIASDSAFAAEVESLKAKLRELFGEGQ